MIAEPARIDDQAAIEQLLTVCDLPHADITASHLRQFWVIRGAEGLVGVVGLEIAGAAALLRSLAVLPQARGRGCGEKLLRHAETNARSLAVEALYLLTVTAEDYFSLRGYERIARAAAPPAMRATAEFQDLCPNSAACMVKQIST